MRCYEKDMEWGVKNPSQRDFSEQISFLESAYLAYLVIYIVIIHLWLLLLHIRIIE